MRSKAISSFGASLFILVSASVVADDSVTDASIAYVRPDERRGLTNFEEKPRAAPFSETVFGVKLNDPYRWMEDDANAGELQAWLKAAGAHTAKQLAALPGRKRLLATLDVALKGTVEFSHAVKAGDRLFFLRTAPGENLPKLYVREGKAERVLVDPADFADSSGAPASINNFTVSPSGTRVAFHIAIGGSEIGKIRFLDVASGKVLEQHTLEPIWGEFSAYWIDDNTVVSTQMTKAIKSDPVSGQQAFRYRLQDGSKEFLLGYNVEGGPAFEPQEYPYLQGRPGSGWLIGRTVGASPNSRLFVTRLNQASPGSWVELAGYDDQIKDVALAGDKLYLQTTKNAPNSKILMLNLARSTKLSDAQIIVPESDDVITGFEATHEGAYVVRIAGGLDTLTYISVKGGKPEAVVLPVKGIISDVRSSADGTSISFSMSGPVTSPRYFDVSGGTVRTVGLQTDNYPNAGAFEVVSEQAISADKTEVPMTILRRRGTSLAGQAPALIFAYGAYGDPMRPGYLSPIFPWLEEGGVFAICHARGGGEKGRSWHEAGKGRNKSNGHADLIACAEHLIERRYTNADRIAAFGFSMAGVLVGPAVLKRPDLFKLGALWAPFLNPTRMLAAMNADQIPEIGDPRTEDGFAAAYEMDAYEWLTRTNDHPDFILSVGLNDNRVQPWFSAKFAARLRSVSDETLVMIRVDEEAGHGIGSTRDQFSLMLADIFTFALNRFGHPDFQGPE